MSKNNDLIPAFINVNVVDNQKELKKVDKHIRKLVEKFRNEKLKQTFNAKTHDKLHNNVVDTLLYLADLSVPIFEVCDTLEEKYYLAYSSAVDEKFTVIKGKDFSLLMKIRLCLKKIQKYEGLFYHAIYVEHKGKAYVYKYIVNPKIK